VRLRRLTPEILAAALVDLSTNIGYRLAAESVAASLAQEDGTGRAIRVIERVMANFKPGIKRRPRRLTVRAGRVVGRVLPAAAAAAAARARSRPAPRTAAE
jgi:hypothetical protein